MRDTERTNYGRPYGLLHRDPRVLYYGSTYHWRAWDIGIAPYLVYQVQADFNTDCIYFTLAPRTEEELEYKQSPMWDPDSVGISDEYPRKSTAIPGYR